LGARPTQQNIILQEAWSRPTQNTKENSKNKTIKPSKGQTHAPKILFAYKQHGLDPRKTQNKIKKIK